MQMSDSPLAQAGRDYFSAEDAQTWEGLLRPGFQLRALAEDQPQDQREPIVAYLGGLPMLPEEVEWPEWKDHGPLNFIAAIDCSQLPTADLDIPLPASGQLLFFYFDGLGDSSVVYSDADSVFNGTRVLYIPDDAEIAEREAPGEMEPFPRLLLTGELIATAPDNENPALIAAYGDSDDPKDPNDSNERTSRRRLPRTARIRPLTRRAPGSGKRSRRSGATTRRTTKSAATRCRCRAQSSRRAPKRWSRETRQANRTTRRKLRPSRNWLHS